MRWIQVWLIGVIICCTVSATAQPYNRADTLVWKKLRMIEAANVSTIEAVVLKELDGVEPNDSVLSVVWKSAGLALYHHGKFSTALQTLEKWGESNPHCHELDVMAACAVRTDQIEKATQYSDEALRCNPRKYPSHTMFMGTVQLASDLPLEAVKTLKEALEKDPENHDYAGLYAWILIQANKDKDAHNFLRAWLEKHPESCQGHYMMGRLTGEFWGMHDKGIEHFTEALLHCNDSLAAENLFVLAQMFEHMQQQKPALKAYNDLLRLSPNHRDGLFNAGLYKTSLMMTSQAILHFERLLSLYGPDQQVHFQLGLCYELEKRYPLAVEQYTEAIRLDSTDTDAWYNRGNANRQLNKLDFALVDYLAVLKLDRNHSDAWFNRGMVHYLKADYRASARDFDNYLLLKPEDAMGFFHRGNSRYYGDDVHGACADWNQCLFLGRKDLWKKTKNICKRHS